MDRQSSRMTTYLGVFLVVCGWAAIAYGWWQAGEQELGTGQLPFLISGGLGGIGLLLLGAVLYLVGVTEREIREQGTRLTKAIEGLARVLAERLPEAATSEDEEESEPPRRTRKKTTRSRSRSRS